ncbi:NADH dehydrogenase (ubiquinone) 1 beta subcomplex subunit 11 [Schistosoma japonicum]|nr:NADH dehydrogenase (ubiquinone) 1 beta subcomplex subunit 11 [Schistosoma japonicum]
MASLKLSALSVSSLRNFHHIAALITPNIKRHIYTTMAVHVELNPMKHILKENNIPEAEKRQIEKEVEELTKLERRRRDGLPLLDKDLVPASQVQLPSDEDLGPDFKIIL